MNNKLGELARATSERTIAYKPINKVLCSSVHGGILLSQIIWTLRERFNKNKVNLTDQDLREQLEFTEREMKTAKNAVKKLEFLKVTVEGNPARTNYEMNWNEYAEAILEIVSDRDLEILVFNKIEVERIDEQIEKEFVTRTRQHRKGENLCNWNGDIIALDSNKGLLYNKSTGKTLLPNEAKEVYSKLAKKANDV